jgi:hypothetical protein
MNAIRTFFDGVIFLLACLLGWLGLPLLLLCGGAALFAYAVVAELAEPLLGTKVTLPDNSTARKMADRLCGTQV